MTLEECSTAIADLQKKVDECTTCMTDTCKEESQMDSNSLAMLLGNNGGFGTGNSMWNNP